MAAPQAFGTINGYISSSAWIGGQCFVFDGTTLGLVKAALASGVKVGQTVQANHGGHGKRGAVAYVITAEGGGHRVAGGRWATRAQPTCT